MKLEVKVDEADVGQVKAGQRATFTVDAFPGRTFPAQILRVDVGANASGSSAASGTTSAASGTVVAYTAVLSVQNPQMILRPGMTATAEIVTSERNKVLLVPNAALRYSPEREAAQAARQGGGGVTKVLVPQRGGRGGRGGGAQRQISIGRGSQQTVYVLGEDGEPSPIRVTVGETNGSDTEVTGSQLREGMKVITGRLVGGEAASAKTGAGGSAQGRSGRRSGGVEETTPSQPAATPPANGR